MRLLGESPLMRARAPPISRCQQRRPREQRSVSLRAPRRLHSQAATSCSGRGPGCLVALLSHCGGRELVPPRPYWITNSPLCISRAPMYNSNL